MNSQTNERTGAQLPRIEHRPQNITNLDNGQDAQTLMQLAGKPLDPWQKYVVDLALAERADGSYAAFEVAVNAPRQNGKNVIIEALELHGLFLDSDCVVITHSAHRFSTARKSFKELERLIRDTPQLFRRVKGAAGHEPFEDVKGIKTSSAEMSIELVDGSKITYVARSNASTRGLTGDKVILDEAYDLTADEIAAMMPTMAARTQNQNPQIIYTSSAGMPSSEVWEKIRNRAISKSGNRLLYCEWSAADDAASDDLSAWYQANPALGRRISVKYIQETEFQTLDDEQFRRERLGIWAQVGYNTVIPARDWDGLKDSSSVPSELLYFAVDVPPSRDGASIGVASRLDDGRIHVELVDRRVGTGWVAQRLAELQAAWEPRGIIVQAGSQAGGLVSEFRRAGVRCRLVAARDYLQACGMFLDGVKRSSVVHLGQGELDEAVAGAAFRFVGDTLFKWARRDAVTDISPLVAVSLAVFGVETDKRFKSDAGGFVGSGWKVVAL